MCKWNNGIIVEIDDRAYYGIVLDIVEMDYYVRYLVISVFHCD